MTQRPTPRWPRKRRAAGPGVCSRVQRPRRARARALAHARGLPPAAGPPVCDRAPRCWRRRARGAAAAGPPPRRRRVRLPLHRRRVGVGPGPLLVRPQRCLPARARRRRRSTEREQGAPVAEPPCRAPAAGRGRHDAGLRVRSLARPDVARQGPVVGRRENRWARGNAILFSTALGNSYVQAHLCFWYR